MSPSLWQILIVALVIFVLFGAGRVPRMMEDLGRGLNAFKKGLKEEEPTKTLENSADKDETKTP